MCFADLKDDGDYKLLSTDYKQKKLKVFMGTNCFYTAELQSKPTALTVYYNSNSKPSKLLQALTLPSGSDNCSGPRAPDILL